MRFLLALLLCLMTFPALAEDLVAPAKTDAEIGAWAGASASEIMTFGHDGYQAEMQQASRHFTKEGWESFTAALAQSHILDNLGKLQQTLKAAPQKAPVILKQGEDNGVYKWLVDAPLLVTFEGTRESRTEVVPLRLMITRTKEGDSPSGVAISQWVVALTQVSAPLDQPGVLDNALLLWARGAAEETMSFGRDYTAELKKASLYFTEQGWAGFVEALHAANTLEGMAQHEQTSRAVVTGAPVIAAQGVKDGVYRWTIEMPLEVAYTGKQDTIIEMKLTLVVSRTPAEETPMGLGISQWLAQLE